MLYDKRWDAKVETKADPFTLESLIAWLEKQPAHEAYDYESCNGACLFGQYMASVGVPWRSSLQRGAGSGSVHQDFRRLVYFSVAKPGDWTFGAALDRARAALVPNDGAKR